MDHHVHCSILCLDVREIKWGTVWFLGVSYSGQPVTYNRPNKLVSTFLVTCGVRCIISAPATASLQQTYTSGAGHPLISANVGWSRQCHIQSMSAQWTDGGLQTLYFAPVNPDWFYQNGSAFLLPAYLGCPGKRPLNECSSSSSSSSSSSRWYYN